MYKQKGAWIKMNTLNQQVLRWGLAVRIGLSLMILCAILALPQPARAAVAAQRRSNNCEFIYRARDGDTLVKLLNRYGISYRYGYTWQQVARYNDIPAPYLLKAGQEICIPYSGTRLRPLVTYTWSVYINGGRIYVTTNGFEDETVFLLRVRSADPQHPLSNGADGSPSANDRSSDYDDERIDGRSRQRNARHYLPFSTPYHNGAWWDLGYLNTYTDQQRTFNFALPRDFRGVSPIVVCLKVMNSSALLCRTIINTYQ